MIAGKLFFVKKRGAKVRSLSLLLILISFSAWSSNKPIPGLIPRFYSIEAASDLEVSAQNAHELAINKKKDISLISPIKNTNLWSPKQQTIRRHDLLPSKRVQFDSVLSSRVGKIRFTGVDENKNHLNFVLSKKVHNILLRKNLLERIGFSVPKMNWGDRVHVDFESQMDKELFIEELKDELIADPKRWIKEEGEKYLVLNDLLIMEASTNLYDLTLGIMPAEIHRERRLLKSPYVAISLVDTPESVNLFSWEAGRVILNQVQLNHTQDIQNTYNTSYEDARWILRRIGELKRSDWEEIITEAHYPTAVKLLLIEKILSRRNDALKLFHLSDEFSKIEINPDISEGEVLKRGELTKEFFEGYVARFSYGDPVSPFSNSEIGSYALSRVQSQAFATGVSRLNKLISTDDSKLLQKKMADLISKKGLFFPTQGLVIPSVKGNLILGRNIVAGSYLGTNNKVQLADTIGVGLSLGGLSSVVGLPYEVGLNLRGNVVLQRTYSHIKPIESLKKAMKEPYKNLLIPFVLKGIGKKINKLSSVTEGNQEALIAGILADLKETLKVGESFIISDSIGPQLSVEANMSLSSMASLPPHLLKVYGAIQSQKVFLSRFHIHRPNKDTLQIYQDDGKSLKLSVSLKISAYVPVLSINGRWTKAKATTEFFQIPLKAKEITIKMLKALRTVFIKQNAKSLRSVQKPHFIEHKFYEKANTLKFLFFKRNRIKANHGFRFTHSEGGEPKKILRQYDAITTGKDYENFSIETINEVVNSILKKDYSLAGSTSLNAGFTIAGKAKNLIMNSEFDGKYFHTTYRRVFNGWKANKKRLKRFVKKLNREFGETLIDPLAYSKTDSILLYQIQLNSTLDHNAIMQILNVKRERLQNALISKGRILYSDEEAQDFTNLLMKKFKRIKRLMKVNPKKMLVKWHQTLKLLTKNLKYKAIIELAGKDNIMTTGRVDGFREGDEAGDSSIVADVYGELDLRLQPSPTAYIIGKTRILQGELLLSWIGERAL